MEILWSNVIWMDGCNHPDPHQVPRLAWSSTSWCCIRAWAHFLKTSAAMGTVELTGLEMMATQASGQYLATPSHRVFTMPASQGIGESQTELHSCLTPPAPASPRGAALPHIPANVFTVSAAQDMCCKTESWAASLRAADTLFTQRLCDACSTVSGRSEATQKAT